MGKAVYILIFLTFGFRCTDKKDCHLENGKYQVVYDEDFNNYSAWEFQVKDDILTELAADSNTEFKVEWISDGRFKLQQTEERTDPPTKLEKQLESLGEQYYEITNCNGDTINFVFRRNEHVIINSGKIIRRE